MRRKREQMSGKEHLIENLLAKKGMRLLKSKGSHKNFSRRNSRENIVKGDELFEWKLFMQKSSGHREKLSMNRPDIVSKLNEMNRIESEKKQKREEEQSNQEWEYHGESGEWKWTGEFDPVHIPDDPFPPLTEEEYKQCKEADKKMMEEMAQYKKKEQKEQRQKKEKERRDAMKVPIDPLPERQLCEYEKIREDIIEERRLAMLKCKFFEDLKDTKLEIGFGVQKDKLGKKLSSKGKRTIQET